MRASSRAFASRSPRTMLAFARRGKRPTRSRSTRDAPGGRRVEGRVSSQSCHVRMSECLRTVDHDTGARSGIVRCSAAAEDAR